LVPEEDMNHLEIVKILAGDVENQASEPLFKTALQLQETTIAGHNRVKMSGITIPNDLLDEIDYTIEGKIRNVIRTIPLFEQDQREGGSLTKIYIKAAYDSIT
jgi:hypothetical protein